MKYTWFAIDPFYTMTTDIIEEILRDMLYVNRSEKIETTIHFNVL